MALSFEVWQLILVERCLGELTVYGKDLTIFGKAVLPDDNDEKAHDIKIQMPKGFIFKVADVAKTKIMRILTPNFNFDHSGKNAFYAVVEFKGP